MSFHIPDGGSSSPPSTPEQAPFLRGPSFSASNPFSLSANEASTTPAGPPPCSTKSFMPAGQHMGPFLESSMMRELSSSGPAQELGGAVQSVKNIMGQRKALGSGKVISGRSIRGGGSSKPAQPSRLCRLVAADQDEDEKGEEESMAVPGEKRSGPFRLAVDHSNKKDAEGGKDQGAGADNGHGAEEAENDAAGDMWLDLDADENGGDESDLMMLATPAANERARKDAEHLFRLSAAQLSKRRCEHKYATAAKDCYSQLEPAQLNEPPELILETEELIARLYDDGVGEAEDEEKLEETVATVAGGVFGLWSTYASALPQSDEEHAAEIGPGPLAPPFVNAQYLANLVLQVHHTRANEDWQKPPLASTLFSWLDSCHNLYPDQLQEMLRHRPSPACHSLFWQALFIALLRGQVKSAVKMLGEAGWAYVHRGQQYLYTGKALENVQRAADATVDMLRLCPGFEDNWDIWSSNWAIFRVRAQGALDRLRSFAEGRPGDMIGDHFNGSLRSRGSLEGMARKAESQVPWDIYENLNVVFEIVLGSQTAILETAQDWCEATVGLFAWWNEKRHGGEKSVPLARPRALALASHAGAEADVSRDRLARSLHTAVENDFEVNVLSPIEVGLACIFEDNANGLIGILRTWSLPIAAAVAEIASLGNWLPTHEQLGRFGMDDLDMDDLDVLGLDPAAPDEVDGMKDSTLVQYAQALADCRELNAVGRDGWELAIDVLGRLDSRERSDETIGTLVRTLLEGLHVESGDMVDKIWKLLRRLGMETFAEDTAETYGAILAGRSNRYGEAMWYYALAHRPNKVREVMNLLVSHSLMQSVAYPPAAELDGHLKRLLSGRNETLATFAEQDLEAAELLGKTLSGYASLRQFYDLRDSEVHGEPWTARRQQAAAALVGVVASADDNIRGGLYDQTRDGIVSEDFLLALLGESLALVDGGVATTAATTSTATLPTPVLTLAHIDVLLKAAEDLHAVGPRVYMAADEFLQLVLVGTAASGNFAPSRHSLLASQLQNSIGHAQQGRNKACRGWDWRASMPPGSKGEDVLDRLRRGVARDVAGLWLAEADASAW